MTKCLFVIDPIESINPSKDSSLAIMLEAQKRGWELHYAELKSLSVLDGAPLADSTLIKVIDNTECWHEKLSAYSQSIDYFDVIFMRKDPPFNMEYLYTTYLLSLAKEAGVLVVNNPEALRDMNEKYSIAQFPQCCAPFIISSSGTTINQFIEKHHEVVIKPLDGMGGASIFKTSTNDSNRNVIIETVTQLGTTSVMVQRYIPEIKSGDKRILLIDGEPIPYALARIPKAGELRGNLAAGGSAEGVPLTQRDHWICQQLSSSLKSQGLLFVGIDVIGDYLTEINITSPTCIRELDQIFDLNIAATLLDAIESKL